MPDDDWYGGSAPHGIGGPPSLLRLVRMCLALIMLVTIVLVGWLAQYALTSHPLLAVPLCFLILLGGSAAHLLIRMS